MDEVGRAYYIWWPDAACIAQTSENMNWIAYYWLKKYKVSTSRHVSEGEGFIRYIGSQGGQGVWGVVKTLQAVQVTLAQEPHHAEDGYISLPIVVAIVTLNNRSKFDVPTYRRFMSLLRTYKRKQTKL